MLNYLSNFIFIICSSRLLLTNSLPVCYLDLSHLFMLFVPHISFIAFHGDFLFVMFMWLHLYDYVSTLIAHSLYAKQSLLCVYFIFDSYIHLPKDYTDFYLTFMELTLSLFHNKLFHNDCKLNIPKTYLRILSQTCIRI